MGLKQHNGEESNDNFSFCQDGPFTAALVLVATPWRT